MVFFNPESLIKNEIQTNEYSKFQSPTPQILNTLSSKSSMCSDHYFSGEDYDQIIKKKCHLIHMVRLMLGSLYKHFEIRNSLDLSI